jgi:hypothetical protein
MFRDPQILSFAAGLVSENFRAAIHTVTAYDGFDETTHHFLAKPAHILIGVWFYLST